MSTNDELKNETPNGTKPVFSVATYWLMNKDVKYCHWSEGLHMVIVKDGVTIELNGEEVQQIVKSLPRTLGGTY
jgi:hypothetical protein